MHRCVVCFGKRFFIVLQIFYIIISWILSVLANLRMTTDSSYFMSNFYKLTLAPAGSSEFADGRNGMSPDSEQMEQTATTLLLRNSGSVEQIQDRVEFLNERQ